MEDIFVSDLGRIVTGKTPRTNISENYGGDIPFLTPTDNLTPKNCEKTLGTLTEKGLKEVKNCLLPAKSICVSCIGSDMGRVIMTTKETVTNQQFNSIIPSGQYDPDYIYYLMVKLGRDMKYKYGKSSTAVPIVSKSMFSQFKVSVLSDKSQQSLVAKLLTTIDDKISLNTRMNAELEAMAKQLYDYWFVQFDFPDENGKPYKSSGGKMVWNEKLKREIPEGWEVKEVNDCVKHINTGLNPRQNFVLGNGDIKYLTVKNLRSDGTIDFSNCDVIDEEARKKVHRRSDIQINDILFASIAPLGRCHLILKEPKDWDINESVFSIRPNMELVSPYYLFIYFMSNWFVQKAEKESAGSIFAGIRVNSLLNIPIIVPQNNIQNLFNEVVESNFIKRDSLSSEINHLTHLRDSLLPMLMNGQVTIK